MSAILSPKQSVDQFNAAVKAGGGNKEAQQAKRLEFGPLHVWVWKGCLQILVEKVNLAIIAVEQTIQTNQDVRQNQDAGEENAVGVRIPTIWYDVLVQRGANYIAEGVQDLQVQQDVQRWPQEIEVCMKPNSESDRAWSIMRSWMLNTEGVVYLGGQAPKGDLERQIQNFLGM